MSRDYKNSPPPFRPNHTPAPAKTKSRSMIPGMVIGLFLGALVAVAVAFFINTQKSPFQDTEVKKKENSSAAEEVTILNPPGVCVAGGEEQAAAPETPPAPLDTAQIATPSEPEPVAEPAPEKAPETPPAEPEKPLDYEFYKILPSIEDGRSELETRPETRADAAKPETPVILNEPAKIEEVREKVIEKPKTESRPRRIYLQFASFSRAGEADNLKAKLLLSGVDAHIQQAEVAGRGLMHRVRVGPFTREADAERVRAQLNAQHGMTSTIVRD